MAHFTLPNVIDQAVEVLIATEQTAVQSTGSGLSDITAGGTTTGVNQVFKVTIASEATPDTFDWTVNGVAGASGVSITGGAQALSEGLTVTFSATTGHDLGDVWTIYVCGNKLGTFAKTVLIKKINIVNVDGSAAASLSIARASDGLPILADAKTVMNLSSELMDFSPEGILCPEGVLVSASASSDIVLYVIATETL